MPHPPQRRRTAHLAAAFALGIAITVALVFSGELLTFLRTELVGLRVVVRNPADPTGLTVTLRIPVEGRVGDRTVRGVSVLVVPSDVAAPAVFTDRTTDGAGALRLALPEDVFVPDGTEVTLAVKTPQTLQRVVVARATRATVTIDLADPSTYREEPRARLQGVPYLPAGDIEGSGPLHDNHVDAFDLAAWVGAYRTGTRGSLADLDANGAAGSEDLSLMIRNMNASGDASPEGVTSSGDSGRP